MSAAFNAITKMIRESKSEEQVSESIYSAFELGVLNKTELKDLMVAFAAHHYEIGYEAAEESIILHQKECRW